MRCAIGLAAISIALSFSASSARADVVVNTSINLTELQITPSMGSLTILSGFLAFADATAQDSVTLSPFCIPGAGYSQVSDGPASAGCVSALASASSSASSLADNIASFGASGASGVDITGVTTVSYSALGEDGNGNLNGTFEILSGGPSTAVNVTIGATLTGLQSLTTTAGGQFATSNITFSLNLYGTGSSTLTAPNLLFYNNGLTIGPNSSVTDPLTFPDTTQTNTISLQTNTVYSLGVYADAESSGYDLAPEPAFSFLAELSLFALVLVVRFWWNRAKSSKPA